MLRKLSQKYRIFIKYSRYYLVVSSFVFIVMKDDLFENLAEKLPFIFGALLGYILIYSFIGFYARIIKSVNKNNWEEVKKITNLQLNFFLFFGIYLLANLLWGLFTVLRIAPSSLFVSNIGIGLVIGALKNKCIYIYENDIDENSGNSE